MLIEIAGIIAALAFAVLVGGFGASLSVRSQLARGAHA